MAKDNNDIKKDTTTPEQNGPEKDPGTAGNQPVEEVKVGFFANALGKAGKMLDTGIGFVWKAGKKVKTVATEHPIITAGGTAMLVLGAVKAYNAYKSGDTPDDAIDVEWVELPSIPEVPEVPQIQEVQAPVEVPQITPEVVEVLDAVEGPTEGIFDEQ